jgi:hypothetical protein
MHISQLRRCVEKSIKVWKAEKPGDQRAVTLVRLVKRSVYLQLGDGPSRYIVSLKFGRSCICRLVMGFMGRVIDREASWGSSLGRGPSPRVQ